jgi:hypothetical protein
MKSSIVRDMKLQKFKKNLISNMVMSRKTISAQGYELPLNAFKLFSASGRYRVPYS